MSASVTCWLALTANASRPSRAVSSMSAIATPTTSGITSSGTVGAARVFFW